MRLGRAIRGCQRTRNRRRGGEEGTALPEGGRRTGQGERRGRGEQGRGEGGKLRGCQRTRNRRPGEEAGTELPE
jgi:hypothetical protein